ncbi:hypothetical protein Tco_0701376 [Tanacetum coccineum]
MAVLPRCDELRRAINSPEWEAMFIFYYRRAISEDLRLAREINALCTGITAIIDERENFVDELDVLVDRSILGRDFELRAREKEIFIEKLKGNMDY